MTTFYFSGGGVRKHPVAAQFRKDPLAKTAIGWVH
jgi:hypothetical protein